MVMERPLGIHKLREVRKHGIHKGRVRHTERKIDIGPSVLSAGGC
jgi:hypothetical protein